MNKKSVFVVLGAILLQITGCTPYGENYDRLNKQAANEYLQPVRKGGIKGSPYWNVYAKRFLYAPAFDFKALEGTSKYRYQAVDEDSIMHTFVGATPNEDLSKIWNDLAIGKVSLIVIALDGQHAGDTVGTRSFYRDYPFRGPYPSAVRSYREAAILHAVHVHKMPTMQRWLTEGKPDLNYRYYSYLCKNVGATIQSEMLLARLLPRYKDEAVTLARACANYLIGLAQPQNAPLAYFPPTYNIEGIMASQYEENQGKTMTMEATMAAQAYLDLFDVCEDSLYYEQALGIARTYVRLQQEDGGIPVKVDLKTGEPVNSVCAMPHKVLQLWTRLLKDYGELQFNLPIAKSEQWVVEVQLPLFNMTGQFEDVSVQGLQPYENLTHEVASPYAYYLLTKDHPSKEEIAIADELIRFSEDQFVHWACSLNADGYHDYCLPAVFEQYKFENPIDGGTADMVSAYYAYYKVTGNKLSKAKAKALADNIVNMQFGVTGQIPTSFKRLQHDYIYYWLNCSTHAATTLAELEELEQ